MDPQIKEKLEISEGAKVILDTVRDELFPTLNQLRDLVVRVHKCRISFPLYSRELHELEAEYSQVSTKFFTTANKLETPNLLFKNVDATPNPMISYFQFRGAFLENLNQGIRLIEIVDRAIDRKSQIIQNTRTYSLAIVTIIASLNIDTIASIWPWYSRFISDIDFLHLFQI